MEGRSYLCSLKVESDKTVGFKSLEIEDLKRWLLCFFREILDLHPRDTAEDFYSAGVDSPQANRGLNILSRYLFLNGKNLNMGTIHDAQNTSYLHAIQRRTLTNWKQEVPNSGTRCQLRILIPYWLLRLCV